MNAEEQGMILGSVVAVPLSEIAANTHQPRASGWDWELEVLAESIAENGLLQPVTLRKLAKGYEIIAGERRCRAFLLLGRKTIPAIVVEMEDQQSAVVALVENLQRKDLNCFEEATAMEKLIAEFGYSQQELGKLLGKTQSAVANKLRLLRLPTEVRKLLLQNRLSERHGRALLSLTNPQQQLKVLQYIIAHKLTVEQTEKYIVKLLSGGKGEDKGEVVLVSDVRIFINTVKNAVGFMKTAGIPVDTQEYEDEEYLHYVVKIPKKNGYKSTK